MAVPKRIERIERQPEQRQSSKFAFGIGAGSRHVTFAIGLAVTAGIAAVAFMLFVAPSGGGLASQDPVAAEADDDPVDVGDIQVPAAGSDGNATTDLPLPGVPLP